MDQVLLVTEVALKLAAELQIEPITLPRIGTVVSVVSTDGATREKFNVAKDFEDKFEKIF